MPLGSGGYPFASRCRLFRDLLAARNTARAAIAEMERALVDNRVLSMAFLRSQCTLAMVSGYKILHALTQLDDERHDELKPFFARLQTQLDRLLNPERTPIAADYILPLAAIDREAAEVVGQEMAILGEIAALTEVEIPAGFVLTPSATQLFFRHNALYPPINHLLQQLDIADMASLLDRSEAVRRLIMARPLPPELEAQLLAHYDRLATTTPGLRVELRTGFLTREPDHASFAGLSHREIEVDRATLGTAYISALASNYSPRALAYRLARGFRHGETAMWVSCLTTVKASISGICTTRSRTSAHHMEVCFSTGDPGCAGERRDGPMLVTRATPHRVWRSSPSRKDESPLGEAEVARLASQAMRLEERLGAPQRIVWSITADGAVCIRRSRPLETPFASVPRPAQATIAPERVLLRGGLTGSDGVGCGPVHIVRTSAEMRDIPPRAVLVVMHPDPAWSPLLPQAAALIAETGSAASHLALLAREYRLPALFSLAGANERLRQDEIVTVDAGGHAVYHGRVDELFTAGPPAGNPMAGSPVQGVLMEALALIRPLHLTDPNGPDFVAARCQTLHDMICFCHHRAVTALWSLRDGDRSLARPLAAPLSSPWWMIDLGHGLRRGLADTDTPIAPSDIASTPLLALWRGLHAFPGQECDPDLTRDTAPNRCGAPAAALAAQGSCDQRPRNCCLITDKYCTLSLRLGAHYAMIEAQTSGRPVDRFLTFRFAAGAGGANQRRTDLLAALAELLTGFDVRVEQTGMVLMARLEGAAEVVLRQRLGMIGALIAHLPQLESATTDASARRDCRAQFLHAIEALRHDF